MRRAAFAVVAALLVALPPAAHAGRLVGTVQATEREVPRQPPRYLAGPLRSGPVGGVETEGGPEDVVVWVEGIGGSPPPGEPPRMVQRGERFVPHVLPVAVGATVEFPNEDDFYHNVFSVVAGDRFDLGRYARGESARQTFTKPGVVVVRCEIHSRMRAYILVLEDARFTQPDVGGAFAIANLPAGTHTVHAWHPTRGEQTRVVTIPPQGDVHVDFVF